MKKTKLKNKVTFIIMCVILVLCVAYFIAGCAGVEFPWGTETTTTEPQDPPISDDLGTLEIHMIDVGQGDCILIRAPEGDMLIDSGDKSSATETAIKTYLADEGVKDLEYVIFTHSDSDHIGAADYIMDTYAVDTVIMPTDDVRTTVVYREMMESIEGNGAKVTDALPGATYSIGDMTFKILAPNSSKYSDVNNYSVVIRVDFGESSFLLTGDAEKKSEEEMVARYTSGELDCDVLKVGHHGSRTSSQTAFLALVTPEAAMISCGEGNSYEHPHNEAIERLRGYMDEEDIYRTDLVGDVIFVTDGEIIKCGDRVLVDESASTVG